ncbi:TetR family transcriptional regulator [Streptomyces sp.]|uniref:TetR family transcriptional regulator n=1 Tax=Streptomyces sp. TaxID=1931 RepID=UPI002F42A826
MRAHPAEPGLRARKKEQTRHDLRESAARLFAANGFAATTVAGITAAANVSERTFFRYLDGKEALLLPDSDELFAVVAKRLAARPADEDPLTAVGRALLAAAEPHSMNLLPTALGILSRMGKPAS